MTCSTPARLYQLRSNRTISPRAGKLGDVALKIPLAALAFRRRAERHDAADARVQALGDALDDAALAGCVAALEDDDDPQALQADPFLQLDEFELQMGEFVDVFVVLRRLARLRPVGRVPVLLDGGDFLGVAQHGFSRPRQICASLPLAPQARAMMTIDELQLNIFGRQLGERSGPIKRRTTQTER